MKSIIKALNKAQLLFENVEFSKEVEIPLTYLEINREHLVNLNELAAICRCSILAFTMFSDYVTINNQEFAKVEHITPLLHYFELPKDDLLMIFGKPELIELFSTPIPPEAVEAVKRIRDSEYGKYENEPVKWLIEAQT